MTEYGRGAGFEPWHPEDPLYGDQGWGGQQDAADQAPYDGRTQYDAQTPYDAQTQYGAQSQYDGRQQYPQGQQYDQYGNPVYQQSQDPYQQQAYQQQDQGQAYPQTQQHYPQGQTYQQDQTHQHGLYPPQDQQAPYGQYPPQDPYGQGQQQPPPGPPAAPYHDGGWGTGQQPGMPYGAPAPDPYAAQQGGYGGENPDPYRSPGAYPPSPSPDQREQWPPQAPAEPEPEPETHPFFTGVDRPGDTDDKGRDSEYDDDPGETREGPRDRRGKTGPKKRRSGYACLVVAAVLVAGVGGGGYFAYDYWQSRHAPPPDFTGVGSTPVQVEVPDGTSIGGIGRLLKKKGVVKSVDAFVAAAQKNPKGKSLQAGVYSLNQQMSAANAVTAMVDPKSLNVLIVPPGTRDKQVYAAIDAKLKLKAGTTQAVAKAKADQLGLPSWAKGHKELKDPLEGFLYPTSYPVADGMKPEDILKKMVGQADEAYGKQDLAGAARKLGLQDEFQVITVASLVQAEGKYKHDFDKVARVVYNRLKPDNTETVGRLEFDSTINYVRKQSTLDVGSVDALRKIKDPYNTYDIKGLPPGPIGNPGADALHSAMHPAPGPWYYFVSVTENKTVFAVTNAEQNRNREKYQKQQEQAAQ
ncbi:endolytic transglycosylase MltG [Streptomyces sp. NPDC051320]|uniref:endolytic transglycosylase MltG n=1 Tax=Streptomyces sp. NPDC051320 TaxID=3154644 RepID=UPI003428BEE7